MRPRDRQTYLEARRGAAALRARSGTAPVAPPSEGAPRNPALAQFENESVDLLKSYILRELTQEELLERLHTIARDLGVEQMVDWNEYTFGDREVQS